MDQCSATVSFEHQLPSEIRNQIYEYVVEGDMAHIARKPLPRKYAFCSRHLLVFCSKALQHEYRQVLAGKVLSARVDATAVVQDLDFKNVIRYLRTGEANKTHRSLLQGGTSRLDIRLDFTSSFDGTADRAMA